MDEGAPASSSSRVLFAVLIVAASSVAVAVTAWAKRGSKRPVTLQAPPRSDRPAMQGPPSSSGMTVALALVEKHALSGDTRRFRFALPSPEHVLGLPVGQHVSLRYTDDDGKVVMRQYTPVSSDDLQGAVDFIIKVYRRGVHPKFPAGGKMSQHLDSMQIGETIDVAGPKGKLTYVGRGVIHIQHRMRDPAPEIRRAKKIGMIAGGTGITPMLQILRKALAETDDTTEFFLLYANQTEQDILCRAEIDSMAREHARVHVWYTVDQKPTTAWAYSVGFVNSEMIKTRLPAANSDVQILMCGPPPMLKFAVLPALEELGFTPSMHFSF